MNRNTPLDKDARVMRVVAQARGTSRAVEDRINFQPKEASK